VTHAHAAAPGRVGGVHLDPPTIGLLLGVAVIAFVLGRVTAPKRDTDLVSAQMTARQSAPLAADDIAALLAQGKKLQAIKIYRDRHPATSLKEAKEAVEAMQAGRSPSSPPAPSAPTHDVGAQAAALKAQGQLLPAVKLVRAKTGWGLKEAKDFVDRL